VIGGHGQQRRGLAGAMVVQIATGYPLTSFSFMPRLQIDKQLVPEYAIFFTTVFQLGYRLSTVPGGLFDGEAYHGVVGGAGFGISMILAERLLLSFRPANLEVSAPGLEFVDVRWDALGGIGVIW
jgi:hypothetical protein